MHLKIRQNVNFFEMLTKWIRKELQAKCFNRNKMRFEQEMEISKDEI
jgi:hypothetical protein